MSYDKFNSGHKDGVNKQQSGGDQKKTPQQTDKVRQETRDKVNHTLDKKR